MSDFATESRVRPIVAGILLIVGIMVVVSGILVGWRYLPGLFGEWMGTMIGLATTPFLLEASFLMFGFFVVFWLNYRHREREGEEWVCLEQIEGDALPGDAGWVVLPANAPAGEVPGVVDQAEGAAEVGDWEQVVELLAGMDEAELKWERVMLLRERLARATGREGLADELAAERTHADHHA